MRAASAQFAAAVVRPHSIAYRCDVLDGENIVAQVPVEAGTITFDRRRTRLANIDVSLVSDVHLPRDQSSVLAPYGYQLRLWSGIHLPGTSTVEELPLGTFPIQRSAVNGLSLAARIKADDRSRIVSDFGFRDDLEIPAGTTVVTALQTLIGGALPDEVDYVGPSSIGFTTAQLVYSSREDRWDSAARLAKSFGYEVFFDGLGRWDLRPEPTFDDTPVADIVDGVNITDASAEFDRGPAVNWVIAVSGNPSLDQVYRGVAVNTNDSTGMSATGRFGVKSKTIVVPEADSQAHVNAAAAAELAKNTGSIRGAQFVMPPDHRLECADVVNLRRSTIGLDGLHIIDQLTFQLDPSGAVTGTTRERQETAA